MSGEFKAAAVYVPEVVSPDDCEVFESLYRAIEHAPDDPGPLAPNLAGWSVGVGLFCCARCAGRILARGCRLPVGADPVWRDNPAAGSSVCCLCDREGGGDCERGQ